MSIQPGDIVLISDAPYTNRLVVKARPCLVVSGSNFNRSSPDVILAPISSNIRYGDPKQVFIQSDKAYFSDTGLKHSSAVKCGAIFAYSQSQIRRRLGIAPPEILEKARDLIKDILTSD
ncbi:type II toxin-antitoxin system PemK/MazF family toxin [bacterium]|nr:type II toxin-antitoxin system PemK/MazF family toxin [bacterium]